MSNGILYVAAAHGHNHSYVHITVKQLLVTLQLKVGKTPSSKGLQAALCSGHHRWWAHGAAEATNAADAHITGSATEIQPHCCRFLLNVDTMLPHQTAAGS